MWDSLGDMHGLIFGNSKKVFFFFWIRHRIQREEKSSGGTAANCYKKHRLVVLKGEDSKIVFVGRGRKHGKVE